MIKFFSVIIGVILSFTLVKTGKANPIRYELIWESPGQTELPLEFMVSADVNGNGTNELLITDFSFVSYRDFTFDKSHFLREKVGSIIKILEWNGKDMVLKWKKQLPPTSRLDMQAKYFGLVSYVESIHAWNISEKTIVESVPPYFQIQWDGTSYRWKEQNSSKKDGIQKPVGSWIFPFQSISCYKISFYDALPIYPFECIIGVREFSDSKEPRVVTLVTKKGKETQAVLRVRKMADGFPIEWEGNVPGSVGPFLDQFNEEIDHGFQRMTGRTFWGLFRQSPQSGTFSLNAVEGARKLWKTGSESDVKGGKTQKKDLWEYWGYYEGESDAAVAKFVRGYLNEKQNRILTEPVSFSTHERFLDIGFFTVSDIDGDGLDELIFVEETGNRKGSGEHGYTYTDIADFIRVVKWNGKKYEIVWTSPPIKERRSKILVDDVIGKGQVQLVVGTGDGKLQIWERK